MSEIAILTRRSYYFREEQSSSVSTYIKQQKIIRALKSLGLDEDELQDLSSKLIDSNDLSSSRIYQTYLKSGIEEARSSISNLKMKKA